MSAIFMQAMGEVLDFAKQSRMNTDYSIKGYGEKECVAIFGSLQKCFRFTEFKPRLIAFYDNNREKIPAFEQDLKMPAGVPPRFKTAMRAEIDERIKEIVKMHGSEAVKTWNSIRGACVALGVPQKAIREHLGLIGMSSADIATKFGFIKPEKKPKAKKK